MGIPMWREPSEANTFKSAVEKDPSASARSSIRRQPTIRRPSRYSSSHAGGAGVLSSLPPQILDEIHRGMSDSRHGVRSPVLNLGFSEDGLDLETSRHEALNRSGTRPTAHRRGGISSRRSRNSRDLALTDMLGRADPSPRPRSQYAPLTPHFAPALSYYTTVSSHPSDNLRLPPLRRTDTRNHDSASYIPSVALRELREFPDGNPDSFRSSGVDSDTEGQPLVDGLGDRQRSVSPDGERETDLWARLLMTIAPDASLPSNSTSFTSNSAATDATRSGNTRQSGNSSQTLPSSLDSSSGTHLSLDPYPDHLHPCDFSSSDEEDTPANYHRVSGSGRRPLARRRSPGLHSTMSSHPPIPTVSFSFSDSSSDPDLHQMQAILDRLARREDIPDNWWAAAGLSRTIGRASADAPENEDTARGD